MARRWTMTVAMKRSVAAATLDVALAGLGHHEVVGVAEAVQHGVRQPGREVGGEVVVEHRIARAPGQQHGNVEIARADPPQRRVTPPTDGRA